VVPITMIVKGIPPIFFSQRPRYKVSAMGDKDRRGRFQRHTIRMAAAYLTAIPILPAFFLIPLNFEFIIPGRQRARHLLLGKT